MSGTKTMGGAAERRFPVLDSLRDAPFFNVLIAIVVIYAILTLITGDTFNTANNQITIMRAASVFLILAVGQTLIMSTGGIDISTGSMIGVVGAIVGIGLENGWMPPLLALPAALLLGALLGAFNGFNVTILGVPPLLATLGTFVAYRGFTQYFMGVNLVTGLPESVTTIGRAELLGLPVAVWTALLVTLLGWFVLRRTLYGRYILAIGSNPAAARATRINVRAITASTYAIQGGARRSRRPRPDGAARLGIGRHGRRARASRHSGRRARRHLPVRRPLDDDRNAARRLPDRHARERPHPDRCGVLRPEDDPRPPDHRCRRTAAAPEENETGLKPAMHPANEKREKQMNRIAIRAAAAALAAAGAVSAVGAQEEPLRIGFVSHQHDITDLFGQLEIGFRERLDEEGLEYEMFQANPTASGRHDEMLNILENMANLNLDYMVFGPSSLDQNTPGLVRVADAGTKILMVDYEPGEGEEFAFEDAVLNWSVYNHGQMGEATGQWIAEHFKSQGQDSADVIMIWGPVASEISQDRGNGVLRGMEGEGFDAEVVYEGYGDFQRELAYAEVERAMIAYPEVDAIVAMNSVMGLGTMSALEAHGTLDEVLVTGMGGQPDELEMVARGKIGVAVFRDPRSMGANSAEALILDRNGNTDDIQQVTYTDLRTLDSVESIREHVPKEMLDIDAKLAE